MPVRVDPAKDQQELVRVPLLFDVLKGAGLTSAAINWPCTRGSTSIADNFPDVPDQLRYTTPRLKESWRPSGPPAAFRAGRAASSGTRSGPRPPAASSASGSRACWPSTCSTSTPPSIATAPGRPPATPPSPWPTRWSGGSSRRWTRRDSGTETAVFVVADHGFAAVTKTLQPNAVLRREGLITVEGGADHRRAGPRDPGGGDRDGLPDRPRDRRRGPRGRPPALPRGRRGSPRSSSPRTSPAIICPGRATTRGWPT